MTDGTHEIEESATGSGEASEVERLVMWFSHLFGHVYGRAYYDIEGLIVPASGNAYHPMIRAGKKTTLFSVCKVCGGKSNGFPVRKDGCAYVPSDT